MKVARKFLKKERRIKKKHAAKIKAEKEQVSEVNNEEFLQN